VNTILFIKLIGYIYSVNGEINIRKRRNSNKTWVPKSQAKGLPTAHKIITVQNKETIAEVLIERANYCTNIEK